MRPKMPKRSEATLAPGQKPVKGENGRYYFQDSGGNWFEAAGYQEPPEPPKPSETPKPEPELPAFRKSIEDATAYVSNAFSVAGGSDTLKAAHTADISDRLFKGIASESDVREQVSRLASDERVAKSAADALAHEERLKAIRDEGKVEGAKETLKPTTAEDTAVQEATAAATRRRAKSTGHRNTILASRLLKTESMTQLQETLGR